MSNSISDKQAVKGQEKSDTNEKGSELHRFERRPVKKRCCAGRLQNKEGSDEVRSRNSIDSKRKPKEITASTAP